MITVLIAEKQEKIKEVFGQILSKEGNTNIYIIKQGDIIKILEKDSLKELVTLKDKIIDLEDYLYNEKRGTLYESILEIIERPLLEHILERTDGNQLKAAKILGINRNTLHSKIKKFAINVEKFKKY